MPAQARWSSRTVGAAAIAVCVLPLILLLPAAGPRNENALLLAATALTAVGLGWIGESWRGTWLACGGLVLALAELGLFETRPSWAEAVVTGSPPLVVGFASAGLLTGRAAFLCALGGLLAGPVRLLVYDPFRDPYCRHCMPQALLVSPDLPLADVLGWTGGGLIGLALLLGAFRGPHRIVLALVLMVSAAAAPGWISQPQAWPSVFVMVLAMGVAVLDIVTAIVWRRRLTRLGEAMRAGRRAEQTLRHVLGDPELRVDYPNPAAEVGGVEYIDADGTPSPATPGSAVAEVKGPAGVRARIHYSLQAVQVAGLIDGLSGEVLLGLEQERLSAILAAQVRQLKESRERLVRQGDAERQALERDLHDGAQQHLLALGFDLQLALSSPDLSSANRSALEQCRDEARAALDDLRDLSHGLYPPLLSMSGLQPALVSLARRVPVGVTVDVGGEGRPPFEVERACYLVVADLAQRSTQGLRVNGRLSTGAHPCFTMSVVGSSCETDRVLAERVAALGGHIRHGVDGPGPGTIEVVIPCA